MTRGAACAVLVAGILTSGPLPAAEPRSAIPWLSESLSPAPSPPPPRRVGRPLDSGSIMVSRLEKPSRDGVGILPPEETGFDRDLWTGASALRVRGLIQDHDDRGVPAARALFRRLLLAETDPPAGGAGATSVLLARIDRLMAIGALDEADALIDRAGPDTAEIFRRWFDIGLLSDRAGPPCAALRRNPQLSPTLPARVFCLARGGDWNAAEITLTLGEEVGSIESEQEHLLAYFLDPASFDDDDLPPLPAQLTPLDFLMREAVGLPRPSGPLPLAFLHADLDEHSPMRTRIEAGERLALSGAIAEAPLFDAYRAGRPAASGGIWDRAAAVQRLDAALAEGGAGEIGEALLAADAALHGRGLRVAFARAFGAALAASETPLEGAAARAKFEILLLAGEIDAARAVAGPAPDARASILLAIAEPGTQTRISPGDDRSRAALAGLEARGPLDDRETRLAAMVEERHSGEALIEALGLLAAGPEIDPAALRAALFTLGRIGQEEAARRIALQTLLLRPGA